MASTNLQDQIPNHNGIWTTTDVNTLPAALKESAQINTASDGVGVVDSISTSLFDYQRMVFKYMEQTSARGIMLYHAVGSGKCMAENTLILMADGKRKRIQDITVGEQLAGDDGSPRNVLSVTTGCDKMYNVWYGKHKYTVNEAHILCLKSSPKTRFPFTYTSVEDGKSIQRVVFTWNAGIYFRDFEQAKGEQAKLEELVNWCRSLYETCSDRGQVVEIEVGHYMQLPKEVKRILRGYKAITPQFTKPAPVDKHVPQTMPMDQSIDFYDEYILGALDTRLQFIANVFDTYGQVHMHASGTRGHISIIVPMCYRHFVDAVVFACNSSGILVDCSIIPPAQMHTNKPTTFTPASACQYRIKIYGDEIKSLPFNQHGSNYAAVSSMKTTTLDNDSVSWWDGTCVKVKYSYIGKYYGFTIDGNHRYLLGDSTVTHNTMTSIAIAEMFRQRGRRAIVLSAKSLQINYQKEIDAFAARTNNQDGDSLKTKYEMITSNSRTLVDKLQGQTKSKKTAVLDSVMQKFKSLEGTVMVVDEAHNLFNSIANGSETANKFYDLVMSTDDIKIVFLTGTPLVNDPFELAIAMNMLKGPLVKRQASTRKAASWQTLLPEHFGDFYKYFVDVEGNRPANITKLKSRIFGLVSYYGPLYNSQVDSLSTELKKTVSKENYPDRLPIKWEVVKMSSAQCSAYMLAREKERLESSKKGVSGSGIEKAKSGTSTSYRIRSRILSNVYAAGKTPEERSPKIIKLVGNILTAEVQGIHVVYSTFLDSGLKYVADLLAENGYKPWEATAQGSTSEAGMEATQDAALDDSPGADRFAIFSGEQSMEDKQAILKTMTHPSNIRGGKIKVLLISKSGTEGLDLKNVRYVHILEPYWNFSLIQQVIARGVRYRSHEALPEDERNVQTIIYMSDYNPETLKELKEKHMKLKAAGKKPFDLEKTTDVHMLHNAIKQQELIDKFLKIMAEASVECAGLVDKTKSSLECFTCRSDGQPLYIPDIVEDMLTAPTCTNAKSTQAEIIMVNGEEIYMANGSFYRNDGAGSGVNKFIKVDEEEATWIRQSM
jgi:hypothetical protein